MKLPEAEFGNAGSPDELIEAFLDGMLSPDERVRVLEAARTDPSFAERLALATTIQQTLRTMPREQAPPSMVAEVLATARREARQDALRRLTSWFGVLRAVDLKPALATASLVAVIVVSGLIGRPAPPTVDPGVQDTVSVAEALEQLKFTLAVVSRVSEEAAIRVRDDVFDARPPDANPSPQPAPNQSN